MANGITETWWRDASNQDKYDIINALCRITGVGVMKVASILNDYNPLLFMHVDKMSISIGQLQDIARELGLRED